MGNHETKGDLWKLMRLREIVGIHETQKDYCGLWRLIETAGES